MNNTKKFFDKFLVNLWYKAENVEYTTVERIYNSYVRMLDMSVKVSPCLTTNLLNNYVVSTKSSQVRTRLNSDKVYILIFVGDYPVLSLY